MKIISKVPQLAEQRGWSARELAEHADIDNVSAWRLLKGEARMNIHTLAKICLAFEVKPNDVVEVVK